MREKVNYVFKDAKSSFKSIDWGFFWVLLISLISPFIYKFLKIYFVGTIDSGVNDPIDNLLTTYQTESGFANLLYETFSIFVIIPIYAFVNKNTKNNVEKKQKFLISFLIGIGMSVILFSVITISAVPFSFFLIDGDNDTEIILFVVIAFGYMLLMINAILLTFLTLKKSKGILLLATLMTLVLHVSLDVLLLSSFVLGEPTFARLLISIVLAPTINLLILIFLIFLLNKKERKEWKECTSTFSFKKWKGDLGIYKKASLFSGGETLYWNLMWFIGIMIPFVIMGKSDAAITTGGLLADSLFWIVLIIPLSAATYLQAESHSHDSNRIEHNKKMKEGFLISFFIAIIWLIIGPLVIIYLYPVMLSGTINNPNYDPAFYNSAVHYATQLSWIMFFFYFFMLFVRIIYTYWVTTNQAFKNFIATFIATTTLWLPIFIIFVINPNLITQPWIIALIYGLGLFLIFLITVTQLWLENVEATTTKIKLPNWYKKLGYFYEPVEIFLNLETEPNYDDELTSDTSFLEIKSENKFYESSDDRRW
ncbi:MAG: hypothetical protein HPAVJP_5320 [Candidatus Hepatoplasma vulgare]|nr:MAG: hypothetical protein HPAVJP_5320 [Candidatus Hepatoplasma sp.]